MCDKTEGPGQFAGGYALKEGYPSNSVPAGPSTTGSANARYEEASTLAFGRGGPLTLENVADAFEYHPWAPDQREAGEIVREALVAAAKAILRSVPQGPSRTRALNHLIDARMIANAAITHRGRF